MATGTAGRNSAALILLLAIGCGGQRAAEPPATVRAERVMVPAPPPPPTPIDPGPSATYPLWTELRRTPNDPDPNPAVPPRLITSVQPEYTDEARTAGIAGNVILQLVIERDGRVSGGKVLKPLPLGLSQKAIDAVQHWRYIPAENELGNPIRSSQTVTVHFRP